jgi:hypothetical protein
MNIEITFQVYVVRPGHPEGKLLRGGIESPCEAQAWVVHFERVLDYVDAPESVHVECRVHPTGKTLEILELETLADEWNAHKRSKQAYASSVR